MGKFECFKRDIPQIKHSCDVRGISYIVKGTSMYIAVNHASPHMIFDEVADMLKRFFKILGASEIRLMDTRTGAII